MATNNIAQTKAKRKYRSRRKKEFSDAWKRRIEILKGGLSASLALAQPSFVNSSSLAVTYGIADLCIARYCNRAEISPYLFKILLAAIHLRTVTGQIYFKYTDLETFTRSSKTIKLWYLIQNNLFIAADAPPTGTGRPRLVYCVSPLGLSIAADFNNCLLSLQEDIKTNKKVPEITAFINAYFDEQIRLYP